MKQLLLFMSLPALSALTMANASPEKPVHHEPSKASDRQVAAIIDGVLKADSSLASKPQVFTYPNGLTLIVEENKGAPVASVQAWCNTGSIHEGKLLGAGLSHILEHMLFKGTTSRAPGVIASQVQDQGGYINAYTSYDRTVYWIDVPAKGASKAVDILADAMMNATLPEAEYNKEQEVIRREFAMGYDNPDRTASLLLFRSAYHVSPFKEPVIGHLDIYNKLTRQDVLDYYKRRYVPNNLCFVVVGDVNASEIRDQLGNYFEKYPRVALETVTIAEEPPQLGKQVARDSFPTDLSRMNIAWRAPGATSPDAPAVEVLSAILGAGTSSILNTEIREKKGLVHQIGAGLYTLTPKEGLIYVGAIADPAKRDAAEKEILSRIEKVSQDGVTPAQLEKAKKGLLSDHYHGLTTMRGRASDYGNGWLMTGNAEYGKRYLESIEKVTPEEVRRVAALYLKPEGLTVTSLDPIATAKDQPDSKPKPAESENNIQKEVLSNGLRVLIHQDNRLPLVSIIAAFRGGLLAETPEKNGISQLTASTIVKGTKTRTAQQIAESVEHVGGSIGASSGNNSFSVAVEVMKDDVPLGMQILSDVLLNATFPEGEVALEKDSQLAAIKAEDDQITTTARNLLKPRLYGDHPYALRSNGSPETVSKLTAADLTAYRDKLVVGKNGVLSIFGAVNPDEVLALAKKDFGLLPSGELTLSHPPVSSPLKEALEASAERQKQQAVIMRGFLGTTVDAADRPALELIEEASSDLGSRFFVRIREKLGLAYFVGASNSTGLAPGAFVFYLGTDPKKVELAKHEFNDEIDKLANDGLTQEELDRAKAKLLGAEAIRNQSSAALGGMCATNELLGLGFDHDKIRKAEIEKVTLDDTKRIANKYFRDAKSVEVIVGPPAAKAAEALHNPTQNP
jgi:zinc protease